MTIIRESRLIIFLCIILTLSACSLAASKGGEIIPGEENVALNKGVTASSKFSNFIPEHMVDGIWDTRESRWTSGNGASDHIEFPHWLEVDLEGVFLLTSAVVWTGDLDANQPVTYAKAGVAKFKLQYWSDDKWEDIPGASVDDNPTSNAKVVFGFDEPVTTNKVRLYSDEIGDGHVRFREILIFGVPAI